MAAQVLLAQKKALKEKLASSLEATKKRNQFASIEDKLNKVNLLAATKLNNPVIEVSLSKKLLLAPNSTIHFLWDLYIMACALYNGISLPIEICFNPAWM